MNGFVQAVREQVWLKVLLSGGSGSGKSRGALELAMGIARMCNSKIAYIGTEGSRDRYYASGTNEVRYQDGQKLFPYDLLQITEPQTPEKYIDAIEMAVKSGYKVLIIDSITHEWKTLNDIHDKMPGNSFTNWGRLKPRHRAFTDKILLSPIHIISTGRGKDEWVLEEKNGKQVPKKVGVGVQADKDTSYDYTVSLIIEQDTHIAHADKDNTGIFNDRYDVLTEKDGEALYKWANDSDVAPTPVAPPQYENAVPDPADDLAAIKKQIVAKCTELGGTKNTDMMNLLKTFVPSGNPNAIRDVEKAKLCLAALNDMQS